MRIKYSKSEFSNAYSIAFKVLFTKFNQFSCISIINVLFSSVTFISGWAIILSRDACQLLVDAKKQTCLFDDEFIGEFLKTKDILPLAVPFLEINSFEELGNLKESDFYTFPLFRFKSIGIHKKRADAMIMQKFHQKRVTTT